MEIHNNRSHTRPRTTSILSSQACRRLRRRFPVQNSERNGRTLVAAPFKGIRPWCTHTDDEESTRSLLGSVGQWAAWIKRRCTITEKCSRQNQNFQIRKSNSCKRTSFAKAGCHSKHSKLFLCSRWLEIKTCWACWSSLLRVRCPISRQWQLLRLLLSVRECGWDKSPPH